MPSFVSPPPPPSSSSSPPAPFDNVCALIQPLLSAYVDEETTPAEAQQIAAHLAGGCSHCANELAFLRLSRAAIARSVTRVAVPASLSERIARATYARPTFADQVRAVLRPAPVRAAAGGLALAAGLAVVLMAPRGGSGGHDAFPRPPLATSREGAREPVIAAAPPRSLPVRTPAVASAKVTAQTAGVKNTAVAAARPKAASLSQNDNVVQLRSIVVLPRSGEGDKGVQGAPTFAARPRDGKKSNQDSPATIQPDAGAPRVLAAASRSSSSASPRGGASKPAVPATLAAVKVTPRDTAPLPAAPPVAPVAPPGSTPPARVAAAPDSPAETSVVMMTASVSSSALKEEGGRLRIVQHRSTASLPAVEAAESVERVRNSETRVASTYQELGQGQGGSGLLVGSR